MMFLALLGVGETSEDPVRRPGLKSDETAMLSLGPERAPVNGGER